MVVFEGAVAVLFIAAFAALYRIGQRVPPRDLIAVARATGSPRACAGYIRFCIEQ